MYMQSADAWQWVETRSADVLIRGKSMTLILRVGEKPTRRIYVGVSTNKYHGIRIIDCVQSVIKQLEADSEQERIGGGSSRADFPND